MGRSLRATTAASSRCFVKGKIGSMLHIDGGDTVTFCPNSVCATLVVSCLTSYTSTSHNHLQLKFASFEMGKSPGGTKIPVGSELCPPGTVKCDTCRRGRNAVYITPTWEQRPPSGEERKCPAHLSPLESAGSSRPPRRSSSILWGFRPPSGRPADLLQTNSRTHTIKF